jgi:hypothetical protein
MSVRLAGAEHGQRVAEERAVAGLAVQPPVLAYRNIKHVLEFLTPLHRTPCCTTGILVSIYKVHVSCIMPQEGIF